MLPAQPFPSETRALGEAERLFAWIFRHWVVGYGDERHWSLVWRDLARRYDGEAASEAVTALAAMVRTICEHARRGFVYHQPCCPCLAADEYRLLAFVTACRAADWPVAARLAEWMVREDGVGDLIAAGERIGRLLDRPCPTPPLEDLSLEPR